MKIAVLAKVAKPITPLSHSGGEAFTYDYVEGLVRAGHDVTLYASSDSETSAKLVSVSDSQVASTVIGKENLARPITLLLGQKLALDADQYDVIHNNLTQSYFFLPFSPFINRPIVHTIHNPFFQDENWRLLFNLYGVKEHEHFVFVSEKARKFAHEIAQSSVIYNGVNLDKFPFQEASADYLLWLSQIIPEKGPLDAVKAATASGKKLIMNTVLYNTGQKAYADEVISQLTEQTELRQETDFAKKVALFQGAKALLFPTQWEEPFGLVMIEAMATGTPVIGYARGSVPEIIVDGVTGFIVNPSDDDIRGDFIIKKTGIAGLTEAIERLYSLSPDAYTAMRKHSRERVETYFSLDKTVSEYVQLYERLLAA